MELDIGGSWITGALLAKRPLPAPCAPSHSFSLIESFLVVLHFKV